MTTDLLVLISLWCFAVFCFGFGWIMGRAAAMARHADEISARFAPAQKTDPRVW